MFKRAVKYSDGRFKCFLCGFQSKNDHIGLKKHIHQSHSVSEKLDAGLEIWVQTLFKIEDVPEIIAWLDSKIALSKLY